MEKITCEANEMDMGGWIGWKKYGLDKVRQDAAKRKMGMDTN